MFSSTLFIGFFFLFTSIACSPLSSSTWSESDLTKVTGQRLNPYHDIKQPSSSPESLHILNTSSLVRDDKGKQSEKKKDEWDALTTTPKRKRGRPITIKKEIIVKTAEDIEEERNARRKKNSELLKERWKDPEYRKNAMNSIKRFWDDPERRLEESKRRKESWAPGGQTRIKHEQKLKQQRESGLPMRKLSLETRQKISASAKLRHAKFKQSNTGQN